MSSATDLRPGGPYKTCSALDDPAIIGSFLNDSDLKNLKLPDGHALKSMYMKALLYKNGGDHMSMIIYASMALWSYRASVSEQKLDDDTQSMFLGLIREGRKRLTEQFKKSADDDTDASVFAPVPGSEMKDKILGVPMDFDNLSGMEAEKRELKSQFLHPNMFPFLYFGEMNNVLLYGPPGTGKTMIVKAVSNEFEKISNGRMVVKMFIAGGSSLRSKWEGGTEKNISELFKVSEETAEKEVEKNAQKMCKSVVFLDEVESIAKSRALDPQNVRSVTTLLQEMDGAKSLKHTLVMAATNLPWQLDTAFLRRFTSKVFVDVPDFSDRATLLINFITDKFLKFNPDIACEMCLVPKDSIDDEGFKKYLGMFEKNDVTIDTFAPEIFNPLPRERYAHLYNDDSQNSSYVTTFTQCNAAHQMNYGNECLQQLNFMNIASTNTAYTKWYKETAETLKNSSGDQGSIKNLPLKLRDYIRIFADSITEGKGDKKGRMPKCVNSDALSGFEQICVLCHYVAELTGPHPVLKVCGETDEGRTPIPHKKTSHLSNNYFGYSNSDMNKLVVYMFQELAQEIIFSHIEGTENCTSLQHNCCERQQTPPCAGKMYAEYNQQVGTTAFSQMTGHHGNVRYELDRTKTNALVTVDPKHFATALAKYGTTTGQLPTMLDFYCFQRSQTDEDPNCRNEGMKRCKFLKFGVAAEEDKEKKHE